MIVLSMDTAHAACSVCVFDTDAAKPLADISEPMQKGHAERLSGMVDEAMRLGGVKYTEVDRLAACSGPGTFTGVRIALSFVRGLALVLKVPAVGVTTFAALSEAARPLVGGRRLWIVQDARRGEVYMQGFASDGSISGHACALKISDAAAQLGKQTGCIAGSGASLLELPSTIEVIGMQAVPDAAIIARLAANNLDPPEPFYLRAPDAKAQTPLVRHEPGNIAIENVLPVHSSLLSAMHRQCFDVEWEDGAISSMLAMPGTAALMAIERVGNDAFPCGFVMYRVAADEAEILTLAVLPSRRRRRVGHRLMQSVEACVRQAGVTRLFLEFASSNEAAANLYANLGFEPAGKRKAYYRNADGTSHDAITAVLNVTAR